MLNIIKNTLKKNKILYLINAKLRSYFLKKNIKKLKNYYNKKAIAGSYRYKSDSAVQEFKSRLRKYRYGMSGGAVRLSVFWIGANQDQDESGFIQALKRICSVTIFYNNDGNYGILPSDDAVKYKSFFDIRKENDDALLEQIAHAVILSGVNLVMGQMWANLISKEALAKVQAMGIPVVNISMDDRLPVNWSNRNNIRLGSVGLAQSLDMVLTTSSETCLWYCVEGCPSLFWPLASDPGVFSPAEGNVRDIDVLFIGNKYGIRGQIIDYLVYHGVRIDCYGNGWPNGYINAEQMAGLSKRARIILGVGSVGHCEDVYTLKLRDFDAPMSGAMYLTHRNPDLLKIYTEGVEIECYETPKEALSKIQFYLANPSNLENLARNGFKKTITYHTWDKRLSKTFEQLGLIEECT